MSFFNDSTIQFSISVVVTLFVGVTAIITSIWIFRQQRSRRIISYEVISDAPIASINRTVKDRVEILFDGNPVRNLRVLVLKIWNSGNVAIKPDDYIEPITFEFEKRKIIGGDILNTEPENLIDSKVIKNFLKLEEDSITIPKFLLNPKEAIVINVLLTGRAGKPTGKARIVDGKIIEPEPKRTVRVHWSVLVGIAMFIIILAWSALNALSSWLIYSQNHFK